MFKFVLSQIFFLLTSYATVSQATVQESQGWVDGIGGKTWYWVFSNPKTADRTPLIILHGGPGATHNYLLTLKALADDQPVVFYDQLGNGLSSEYDASTPNLWTIPRFVGELRKLVHHLGYRRVNILGHSWGTVLAFEYYKLYPHSVQKLIMEGPALSDPLWFSDQRFLRELLPDDIKNTLKYYESIGGWDQKPYQDAIMYFYRRHLNRMETWPQVLIDGLEHFNGSLSLTMLGPDEFQAGGVLKDYDATNELHIIKVPTLFVSGQFDQAQPGTVRLYASHVKNAEVEIFPNSAHTPHLEETSAFLAKVADFLIH